MEKSVYDILHLWNDPDAKYCWFSVVSTVASGLFLDHTRVQSLIKFIIIYEKKCKIHVELQCLMCDMTMKSSC